MFQTFGVYHLRERADLYDCALSSVQSTWVGVEFGSDFQLNLATFGYNIKKNGLGNCSLSIEDGPIWTTETILLALSIGNQTIRQSQQ